MEKKFKTTSLAVLFLVLIAGIILVSASITTHTKTSIQNPSDASCVYDAGSRGVLSGHEIVAENPIHIPGNDCNTFTYLNLGEDTDVLSKKAEYSSGDHGCVYSCPVNYGLSSVVSENPGTSDCNNYKCLYIGTGGDIYHSLPWVSGTSPPSNGAPWYSTDDSGCVYKCPTDYALQYFVAEVPSGVGDCNSFTCQKVNLPAPIDDDEDDDGYNKTEDCDDHNPLINPGAIEICDGLDNNCDGNIDENDVCENNQTCSVDDDCPMDYLTGLYCSGNNIVITSHDFGCVSCNCFENITTTIVETCAFGCANSACKNQTDDDEDDDNKKSSGNKVEIEDISFIPLSKPKIDLINLTLSSNAQQTQKSKTSPIIFLSIILFFSIILILLAIAFLILKN